MGQVSLLQALLQFCLHCVAVASALASTGLLSRLVPRWRIIVVGAASFAAAFVAHIITFIVLKAILGGEVLPEIHRPVVGIVWGTTSGLVVWLMLKRQGVVFWSTAFLTTCAYFVFVLLRPFVP